MGMNMVTISTKKVSEFLETQTTAKLISLSGNLCSDKKPAAINAIEGRGRTVSADVLIPRKIVEDKLHTTPETVVEINTQKNYIGSARAVSLGHNAQAANIIAAIFLATGQDAAQVVEGANAITTADVRDGGLYLSVTLLSLEIGTIGGGTHLPSQSEALDIMGVRGGGNPPGSNADSFAEIISAGVLAGELSLLSALGSRDLSSAHERLGR
jgi:hydroxymethylglutaryl-CoA reductase (NADPH)